MAAIDVIEWRDMTGNEIVHRWPRYGSGDVTLGAQLTVRESQQAVFFRDGKALDTFKVGRHTLTTANIPLLQRLINIPFGGDTPFQAEVYFVNMKTFTDLKWGTASPIVFRDSELDMVRLRGFGGYTMRVDDAQLFVNEVVGTQHVYDTDTVTSWLREFICSQLNDVLGEVMDTVLDLPQHYEELGQVMRSRLGEDFRNYGLELVDFKIAAINPPDEVLEMIDQRSGMAAVGNMDQYMRFRTAQAIGDMPQAEGGGGAAAVGAGMGAGIGMGSAMMQAMQPPGQQRAQQQAPAGGGGMDVEARLEKLASLKEKDLITEEEFAARKAEIIKEI
jgi:membrane protease subunit (stomatin/prohibitin family)